MEEKLTVTDKQLVAVVRTCLAYLVNKDSSLVDSLVRTDNFL